MYYSKWQKHGEVFKTEISLENGTTPFMTGIIIKTGKTYDVVIRDRESGRVSGIVYRTKKDVARSFKHAKRVFRSIVSELVQDLVSMVEESVDDRFTISFYENEYGLIEQGYFPSITDCKRWANEMLSEKDEYASERPSFVIEVTGGALTFLHGKVSGEEISWEETPYPKNEIPMVLPTWGINEVS